MGVDVMATPCATVDLMDTIHHCPWIVQVPSGNPEPDSPADLWKEVECGAPITPTHNGQGWECDAGHSHVPLEIAWAPCGPEWEREQNERAVVVGR